MSRHWMAQLAALAALSSAAPVALWLASPAGRATTPPAWETTGLTPLPEGFRDVAWTELVPAGWDPLAAYRGINTDRVRDSDPIARDFERDMLQAYEQAPMRGNWTRRWCGWWATSCPSA